MSSPRINTRKISTVVLITAALSAPQAAFAEGEIVIPEPPDGGAHPEEEPSPEPIAPVTVRGRALVPSVGASDYRLPVGALRHVPRRNAAEMLELAPGILLTNEGGEGHPEQIFLRGFDAREGQDLELSVGGISINDVGNLHGNGVADTHFVIPELVRALRVVEGPFDPRQGNFAVAGSADYELGLERRGLTAKYTLGSHRTRRALLMWGPRSESVHTFGGASIGTTQGFGQNRDAKHASAMGQYEGPIGERGSYRVTTQAYTARYHSAGVIREDDYQAGRKGFFDTNDYRQGGASSRYSAAGDIEVKSGAALYKQSFFFVARSMRTQENFTGFLLDVQKPQQNPHPQRGDLIDRSFGSTTLGARGSSRISKQIGGSAQELELGYFARGDFVDTTQYRIESATGHPYHLDTSLESRLGDIGAYGDLALGLTRYLRLRGGLRADLFSFDVLNRCAVGSVAHPSRANPPGDASCLSQQDFGRYREPVQRAAASSVALMPRATMTAGPFEGVSLSASYGEGVRSIDPSYITEDRETPFASMRAFELGQMYAGGFGDITVVGRSSFFYTHVDRDLIFNETEGRSVLALGTTRIGWAGLARLTGDFFDQAAHLTWVRSTFDDTGKLVPYVPDLVVRSDSTFFHDLPLTIANKRPKLAMGLGLRYVGRRALPHGQRSDEVFTADGQASLGYGPVELTFSATNLLGRRYRLGEYNYASDFTLDGPPSLVPVRHFTAGQPRTLFVSLALTWEEDA